jgi:hypothetical protein
MIAIDNFERVRFTRTALQFGLCALIGTAWGCQQAAPVTTMTNATKQAGSGAGTAGDHALAPKAAAGGDSSSAGKAASANGGTSGDHTTTTGTATANGGQGADGAAGSGDAAGGTGSRATSGSAGTAGSAPVMSQQPVNVVQACVGHAGANVCDGTTLHQCGEMGSSTQSDPCKSATLCQAGIGSGKCGVCEPNEYQCSDATPASCNAMGQWEMQKPCASAALCTAGMSKHSCDPGKCEAGKFDCSGGLLRKCKDDLTDWDTGTACEANLCDMTAGKCNECKPGSKATCSDPKTVSDCTMDGKKKTMMCSGSTSNCLDGKCVQCMSDTDCKAPNDCQMATCDMGTCKNTVKSAHSSCKLGGNSSASCDYLGNCLACVDDSDCHSAALQCNPVLGCIQRAPLQATAGLPGAYGVTVAPGKTVTGTVGGTGICSTPPLLGSSFSSCVIGAPGCSVTADTKSTMATTVTVAGPAGGICLASLGGPMVRLGFMNPGVGGMAPTGNCEDCVVTLTAQ